jgi:hypothetical protein
MDTLPLSWFHSLSTQLEMERMAQRNRQAVQRKPNRLQFRPSNA